MSPPVSPLSGLLSLVSEVPLPSAATSTPPPPVPLTAPQSPSPIRVYHPEFSAVSQPDWVVTLLSCDRVAFSVSANALKSASGFFERTLSPPRPVNLNDREDQAIDYISENAETIGSLLKMITGKEIPTIDSLDTMEPLLLAAQKYEMRVPSGIMRGLLLTTPTFLKDHIKLYFLGCRLGWGDVVKLASKYSCSRDFFERSFQQTLRRMDACDLLRLMAFHKNRREGMDEFLRSGELAAFKYCHMCTPPQVMGNSVEFENFRWQVLNELDHTPPARPLPVGTICTLYERSLGKFSHSQHHALSNTSSAGVSEARVIEALDQYWTRIPQTL